MDSKPLAFRVKAVTMSKTKLIIISAVFLSALSIGALYAHETQLLSDARRHLTLVNYRDARNSLDQVAFPPFTSEAGKIRKDVDAAEQRDKASRLAQVQVERLTAALKTLDDDDKSVIEAIAAVRDDVSKGSEEGQARHDDAISGSPNISFDLQQARLENASANKASSDANSLVSALRAETETLRDNLGSENVRKLQDEAETVSTQYDTFASAWSSAVRPMIDSMVERQNGRYYASSDSGQIERFYQESSNARSKADAAFVTFQAERNHVYNQLKDRRDSAKATVTQ